MNYRDSPGMKNRFLLVLMLAGLAAAVYFLWFEHGPSTEPANTGGAGQRSQVESERDPGLPLDPGERDAAARISATNPDAAAAQADNFAATDISESTLLRPAGVDRATSDLPDDEESEKFFIGGLVQDEEGNPQSNIEVLAERLGDAGGAPLVIDPARGNVRSIYSDFTGTFLFSDLEDGEYRVRLAPLAGIAPAETKVRAGTLNVNLVLVVLREVRVYGMVNSTDGAPVEDVHIVAEPTTRSTSTGSRGEYNLYVDWQGKDFAYTILFRHKDFRQQRIRINPADLEGLTGDFQLNVSMEPLKRLTSVTGRLTDTEGSPVGGEILHLVAPRMRTWYRAQSDSRGNFLFEDVEPAEDFQLQIRPVSIYKNKEVGPLVVRDSGLKLDVVLEFLDEGELSGWMINLDGDPVPGFSLTLSSLQATAQSVSVVSDQEGFFSVAGFPVGEAVLRTHSDPLLSVLGIRVTAEPEKPITVILDIGRHVLQGWVIDGFGEPVAATSVTLDWGFNDIVMRYFSVRKTKTDQNGNFFFTGLGPGLHKMQVSAAGFNTAMRTIDVSTDPVEIVVELEEETP
jgi:hypothetical protein